MKLHRGQPVVICFQISIFDTIGNNSTLHILRTVGVVICFQISIFDTIGNNAPQGVIKALKL